jgi:hypothetical protein
MGYSPFRSYRLAASENTGMREMPSTKKRSYRGSGAKTVEPVASIRKYEL